VADEEHEVTELPTLWRRALDRVPASAKLAGATLGPLGVVIGVVIGARDLWHLQGPGWAKVLAWLAAGLVVGAMALVLAQQLQHRTRLSELHARYQAQLERSRRQSTVDVALPQFHRAFHKLRDAAAMIRSGDSEAAVTRVLEESLQSLSAAFSVVTGANCRACIKRLYATADAPDTVQPNDPRYLQVSTLCRHDGSHHPQKDAPTPLHENSDFRNVWDPMRTEPCFFSNDLDAHPNYVNPHRDGTDPNLFDYNASIVWPIQYGGSPTSVDLWGFLCVDSKAKQVFRYQNDFDLGATYADTVYTVLSLWDQARAAAPAGENR
jgi:hypothetical protein